MITLPNGAEVSLYALLTQYERGELTLAQIKQILE